MELFYLTLCQAWKASNSIYWTVHSLFLEVYSPWSNVYVDTKSLRNALSEMSCASAWLHVPEHERAHWLRAERGQLNVGSLWRANGGAARVLLTSHSLTRNERLLQTCLIKNLNSNDIGVGQERSPQHKQPSPQVRKFIGLSAKPCRGQQRENKVSRMLLRLLALALSLSFGNTIPTEQKTLISQPNNVEISTGGQDAVKGRALQGRFLHITGTPDRDPAAAWWSPSNI